MTTPGTPAEVDWYFDVVSPFAYLQAEQLAAWVPADRMKVHPVVLGALLARWETRGPAEIPAKRIQTYRSALARSQQLGIPLRFPPAHPFNPVPLLRLVVAAGQTWEAAREALRFVWRDGEDPAAPDAVQELASRLGRPDAAERSTSEDVKLALRGCTEAAGQRGVFGVPTLAVHDELFWGEDATAMARTTWELGPAWLRDREWGRVAALPVGVQRKT